jgi:hypothetical protein
VQEPVQEAPVQRTSSLRAQMAEKKKLLIGRKIGDLNELASAISGSIAEKKQHHKEAFDREIEEDERKEKRLSLQEPIAGPIIIDEESKNKRLSWQPSSTQEAPKLSLREQMAQKKLLMRQVGTGLTDIASAISSNIAEKKQIHKEAFERELEQDEKEEETVKQVPQEEKPQVVNQSAEKSPRKATLSPLTLDKSPNKVMVMTPTEEIVSLDERIHERRISFALDLPTLHTYEKPDEVNEVIYRDHSNDDDDEDSDDDGTMIRVSPQDMIRRAEEDRRKKEASDVLPKLYVAIADYDTTYSGYMCFKQGDEILVTERITGDLWMAECGNNSGYVPADHLREMEKVSPKEKSFDPLIERIRNNERISEVDFSNCNLKSEDMTKIGNAILQNDFVTQVDFSGNQNIGNDDLDCIVELLQMKRITKMDLRGTTIENFEVLLDEVTDNAIEELLLPETADPVKIVAPLQQILFENKERLKFEKEKEVEDGKEQQIVEEEKQNSPDV